MILVASPNHKREARPRLLQNKGAYKRWILRKGRLRWYGVLAFNTSVTALLLPATCEFCFYKGLQRHTGMIALCIRHRVECLARIQITS
jgi:hypothetical protein